MNGAAPVGSIPADVDRPDFFADALSPAFLDDPYAVYERYRRADGPVRIMDGLWVALRHADATSVLRGPAWSSDERRATNVGNEAGIEADLRLKLASLLVFLDPPDHTRLRHLVAGSFSPSVVERLRPRVEVLVHEAIAQLEAAAAGSPDGAADFIEHVARPLPVQVICELLGVPPEDGPRFRSWSAAMGASLDPSALRTPETNEAIARAAEEFAVYLDTLIVRRTEEPDDGLVGALLDAERNGAQLSRDELLHLVFLMLIAGHETTVSLLGNAVDALSANPREWNRLVADPSLLDKGVDELLRFDSPVQMAQRTAISAQRLGDVDIATGDQVLVLLGGANRDPAFVREPAQLDLARGPRNHVGFGGGIHHCIGASLARMEAQVVLHALVTRLPGLHVARPGRRRGGFVLRGFDELHVRW